MTMKVPQVPLEQKQKIDDRSVYTQTTSEP